jgi:hypothetical protein
MALRKYRQLAIAENEKYAHVTYFFNGGYADPAAGERGTIIIAWWDSELGRRRWVVGEVGIDGIVADTPYRVVDGALVEVES